MLAIFKIFVTRYDSTVVLYTVHHFASLGKQESLELPRPKNIFFKFLFFLNCSTEQPRLVRLHDNVQAHLHFSLFPHQLPLHRLQIHHLHHFLRHSYKHQHHNHRNRNNTRHHRRHHRHTFRPYADRNLYDGLQENKAGDVMPLLPWTAQVKYEGVIEKTKVKSVLGEQGFHFGGTFPFLRPSLYVICDIVKKHKFIFCGHGTIDSV